MPRARARCRSHVQAGKRRCWSLGNYRLWGTRCECRPTSIPGRPAFLSEYFDRLIILLNRELVVSISAFQGSSALCVGPKRWAQTSGLPAGRARFLAARDLGRARFSSISGPAWLGTVSVHDQARRECTAGLPDFVHWRPCSNGGLRTARRRHCANPCWNRPSSAQSPGRRFRAPRAAGSRPAGCPPARSAEVPFSGLYRFQVMHAVTAAER